MAPVEYRPVEFLRARTRDAKDFLAGPAAVTKAAPISEARKHWEARSWTTAHAQPEQAERGPMGQQ